LTDIYFIRHAESDFSVKDDLKRPLTFKGNRDSIQIPILFEGVDIDAFFSSPCKRAVDTINPLCKERKKDITQVDDFRERKIGQWIDDFFEYASKQWNDFSHSLLQGESLEEVQKRNVDALKALLVEYKEQSIVIGTHGTALCTIINYYDYTKGYEYFKSIVDVMPLIVKMRFEESRLIFMHEMRL